MRSGVLAGGLVALAGLALAAPARGQFAGLTVMTGLSRPVFVTAPPGDYSRLFILEKGGNVRVADITTNPLPTVAATPVLTVAITGNTNASDERGLLGLAFHPQFLSNGRFYINYTATNASSQLVTRIAEVTMRDPVSLAPTPRANVADPASLRILMEFTQPQSNHNGGWMGFGPDGNLYISQGDGGDSYDDAAGHTAPGGNGQDITRPLGKMLRINVDGVGAVPFDGQIGGVANAYRVPADNPFAGATAGRDEIWAYGLRNAWRPSFDRLTGDLWISDVGQDFVEEINFQPAITAQNIATVRGRNYGWRCFEGTIPVVNSALAAGYNNNACPASFEGSFGGVNYVGPVGEFVHPGTTPPATPSRIVASVASACSITGGYVYRGCAVPELRGQYLFTDYCAGRVYRSGLNAAQTQMTAATELAQVWAGFAMPAGAATVPAITRPVVSLVSFGEDAYGEVYIVDQPGGRVFKIIPVATSRVPLGNTDADRNGIVTIDDIFVFLNQWFAQDGRANFDRVGTAPTIDDIFQYLNAWFRGSCPF